MRAPLALIVCTCGAWAALTSPLDAQARSQTRPSYSRPVGPAGAFQYVPDRWGIVAFTLSNPTDAPRELLSTSFFEDHPATQYGRRVVVPPGVRRRAWFPLLPPAGVGKGKGHAHLKSLLVDLSEGPTATIRSPGGLVHHDSLLSVARQRPVTGLIPDPEDDEPRAALTALRIAAGGTVQLVTLGGDPYPPVREALDALDQLALSSDGITRDAAGLTALRRWLFGGGRLWIMLDEVSTETVSMLLGDNFRCHVVDRVGLNEIDVRSARLKGGAAATGPRHFEVPVDLVRVVVQDAEVSHTVAGWPAAFWQNAGRGRVLFTTLAGRGWYRDRTPADPQPKEALKRFASVATPPLVRLSAEMMQPATPPILEVDELRGLVDQQIGYRIVSRGAVLGVLGAFCGLLLVAGLWLVRTNRLALLGVVGPVAAVVAAFGLAGLGRAARRSVPPTLAMAQLIEAVPGVDDVRMSGLVAIYNQEATDAPLGATAGGLVSPELTGGGGSTRRMIWSDFDRWEWQNLQLPQGVCTAPFTFAAEAAEPLAARATLGPEGVAGRLATAGLQEIRDAILVTPSRRNLAVRIAADGTFTAGPDDLFAAGQYLAATVVDQRQRQRQAIYRRLLDDLDYRVARPTLLAWARPAEMHFQFPLPAGAEQRGAAPLMVPLELSRPAVDTRMAIPAPLLPYQTVAAPGRTERSATYDNANRRWIGPLVTGSQTLVRFQIPPAVLPVRVVDGRLTVKISAPGRRLHLVVFRNGARETLAERESPVETLTFPLAAADLPPLDDAGGLLLGLEVGNVPGQATRGISEVGWQIEEVTLRLTAETIAP